MTWLATVDDWLDERRGVRWWPVKTLYYLGWIVVANVITAGSFLVIWAFLKFLLLPLLGILTAS